MNLSDIITHLGEDRHEYCGSVGTPIFQSSNFSLNTVEHLRNVLKDEYHHPFYSRGYNPTVAILRKKIAALEGAEDALIFSSGSAAIAATIFNLVKAGDHIISVKKPYSWSNYLFTQILSKYSIETTMVDGTISENFEKAIQNNTKVIFIETPNSMTFELQNITEVVTIAKRHNCIVVLDNSYNSPLFQPAIELGVDLVCHSATKYISGHSDVLGGVVCGTKERINQIFKSEYMCIGASISAQDAALLIRGLRTLPIRMKQISENARRVADFLDNHSKIEKLYWPFANSNPQLELAKKQMKNCGGLMSITIKTDNYDGVERFVNALQKFLIATSWGGYESLVFPVCAFTESKENHLLPVPWNLVRIYIGLEDSEELISDLKQALEKV